MNTPLSFFVLNDLQKDELLSAFFSYLAEPNETSFSHFLHKLFSAGAEENFAKYLTDKILLDENAFSKASAKRAPISFYLKKAYEKDLSALYHSLSSLETKEYFALGKPNELFFEDWGNEKTLSALTNFYARFGYGSFISHRAFRYEEGKLSPVDSVSEISLSDLKDYETEKKIIGDNLEKFLEGLPYSHMLLYGARGTGKSSTVHAMLNRYFDSGLRLVELSKENMLSLNILKGKLAEVPLKFIVYIDDLSLGSEDKRISSLKGSLEGSVEGHAENVMIVATSNRRHIIDEKFSSREDSVHAGDSEEEELSLSDRFGISLRFPSTTKAAYLSIVEQLAADYSLKTEKETLLALAERWALSQGGRSPRRAKQFITFAYACEKKDAPIEF